MKKSHILILTTGTLAVVLTGCEYPNGEANNTGTGALVGGGIGVISGAAIGGPRHGGAGALIGGAIGAITGALVGNSMDEQQREYLREQAPQTYVHVEQSQPLALADVKALAQAKVSDDLIISQIRATHTIYHLSAADIIDLRGSGVSETVIKFMLNTPNTVSETASTTQTVVSEPPPPAPEETVIVAPPEPGYVWISGEWIWNGGWYWSAGHWGYPPEPHEIWIRGDWVRGPYGWHHEHGYWR